MTRQMLDEFLDGALDEGQRTEVLRLVASDPAVATLISQMRQERAARAEAFATYEPAASAAAAAATRFFKAAYARSQPVARTWLAYGLSAAAALILVAGSFFAGRQTAPTPAVANATYPTSSTNVNPYTVVYWNGLGEPQVRQFSNVSDVDTFVADVESRQGGTVASITPVVATDEGMDLSQRGSF